MAAVVGCSTAPPAVDGSVGDAAISYVGALSLGEGERGFAAIEPGRTLLLARGCQGSQHVWITLRLRDLEPRGPIVRLELRRVRDDLVISAPLQLRLSFTPDESGDFAQLTGLTLQVPDPDAHLDEDLVLEAVVVEGLDRTRGARAEETVRIAWGPEVCGSMGGTFGTDAGVSE